MQPDLVWTLVFMSQRWSTMVNDGQTLVNGVIQVNTEDNRGQQNRGQQRSTEVNCQLKPTEVSGATESKIEHIEVQQA